MSDWTAPFLVAAALVITVVPAAPAAQAEADLPVSVFERRDVGPRDPAAGRSLFDEIFATQEGVEVPFPFDRLLDVLRGRVTPSEPRTALIPIGRSLQRFAADPDYFGSPRVVVAVDAEGPEGISRPRLKDRLFLAYQPAAEIIEVISYNETAGRFEFQEIARYNAAGAPLIKFVDREICARCHQGGAPIFATPLWSETNANPDIAARLAPLGRNFHGVRVRQGVDGPDAFDRSTDRANRILVIDRLWDEGCGPGAAGARCRAEVLGQALEYGLGGARPGWRPRASPEAMRLHARVEGLWPRGLGIPDPDLPNRNPGAALTAGLAPRDIVEAAGAFDPESPRDIVRIWSAGATPAETVASMAKEVAAFFAPNDLLWLDRRLRSRLGSEVAAFESPCRARRVERSGAAIELRLDCRSHEAEIDGYVLLRHGAVVGGRISPLRLGDGPPLHLVRIPGGALEATGDTQRIALRLQEGATGLSARLVSGELLSDLSIVAEENTAVARISVRDDLAPLHAALARIASDETGPLWPGPIQRRALLAALDRTLGERGELEPLR